MLRIRIYPDEISVVTSAPGMSSVEQQAGLDFWTTHEAPPTAAELADPGALAHRRTAAWELLVRHVGRERAAFVANSTRPGAPPLPLRGGAPEPATARLLPDSWVVVGYNGGQRVLATHVPGVPERVQVGPSRTAGADAFDPKDPNLLKTEDGLRWVTDFDEAERIAMAVTVDLLAPEDIAAGIVIPMLAINGLDTLMVFGVREPNANRTAASEADALVDLLSAHAATDRVAFVPQGTPTNNADGRASGWTSAPDIFAAYERVVGAGPAPAPATGVDALRGGADNATTAAAALGLAPDALVGLDNANALEQWPARAMARALFPVTVGEVLGTLSRPPLASGDEVEQQLNRLDELIPFAAEHMASFVRSRGPLPVLRVGRQPYGLLPILPHRPLGPPRERARSSSRTWSTCWTSSGRSGTTPPAAFPGSAAAPSTSPTPPISSSASSASARCRTRAPTRCATSPARSAPPCTRRSVTTGSCRTPPLILRSRSTACATR